MKFFTKRLNNKGFTLVELIVVIAILGILVAIAVPRLSGFRDSASTAADDATARTIESVVAVLIADGTAVTADNILAEVELGDGYSLADGNIDDTADSIDVSIADDGTISVDY